MKYNFYNMKPQKPLLTVRLMRILLRLSILHGLNLCNKETLKVPAKIKRLLMPLGG